MNNRFFPNYDTYIITSRFGPRIIRGVSGYHSGIDLVAKGNGYGAIDHIMAHTGGIIESCGYNDSAGNYVRIRVAPNTIMSYCHFHDKLAWKEGQKVEKGEILGYMGKTGNSTGAHLHWGINYNGSWIDPEPYLDKDYTEPAEAERKMVSVSLPVIREGYRGEDVKAMQTLLILRSHECGEDGADGKFGPATKAALLDFQTEKDLAQDKVCGPATWLALIVN